MSLTKVSYSMINGAAVNVLDFGAIGDGTTNNSTSIQAAIDYAALNNLSLYFPSGVYAHTSTLVWKNGVRYFGPNVNTSNSLGAVFVYTGSDDANVINNPINASTFASIRIEGLTFVCASLASGKALFYDTGSTYLYIENCKFNFAGAGSFGLVFHQTEVSVVSKCIFELLGGIGLGALLRLADGPVLKHPTANVGYTNRITISENQFNGASGGVQAICVWDDGYTTHTIRDNNFNAGAISIYLGTPNTVSITGNELEGYTLAGVSCGVVNSGVGGLRIDTNYFLGVPPALSFAAGSISEMIYTGNIISVLTVNGSCETNLEGSPLAKIFATSNREISLGKQPYNNYLQANVDTVGTMLLAGSTTAGAQTYSQNTMTWRTMGDVCFFNVHIILTNKDAATAGNIRLTGLPFPARLANAQATSVTVAYLSDITLTASYTQLSGIIQPGNSFVELVQGGSGQAVTFLPAAGIANTTQIMVSGVYPI